MNKQNTSDFFESLPPTPDGLKMDDLLFLDNYVGENSHNRGKDSIDIICQIERFIDHFGGNMKDIKMSCNVYTTDLDLKDYLQGIKISIPNSIMKIPCFDNFRIDTACSNQQPPIPFYSSDSKGILVDCWDFRYYEEDKDTSILNKGWNFRNYKGSIKIWSRSSNITLPEFVDGNIVLWPGCNDVLNISNVDCNGFFMITDPSCKKILINKLNADTLVLCGTNKLSEIIATNSNLKHLYIQWGQKLERIELRSHELVDVIIDEHTKINSGTILSDSNYKLSVNNDFSRSFYIMERQRKSCEDLLKNRVSHFSEIMEKNPILHFYFTDMMHLTISESITDFNTEVENYLKSLDRDKNGRCVF